MADQNNLYLPRVVDQEIEKRLQSIPTVLIEGPKGCGKTTTGRHFGASEVLLDDDPNAMVQASVRSPAILDGATPRLIDEWQRAPGIWDMVRRASDDRRRTGQFILTGSANPPDDITRHSGVGRVTRVQMRPMSLFETGLSNGDVSLVSLFAGEECSAAAPVSDLGEVIDAVCRGGWPQSRESSVEDAQDFMRSYLDEIARVDISRADGVRRDPVSVRRLLRSLARNVSTTTRCQTLAADTGGPRPIDRRTVGEYLNSLERLFIVEDLPAWSPRLRSRSVLRSSPKRHFVDPSLAAAAMLAGPSHLINDLETFGFLFESLAVRDLRVYAQIIRGHVAHYLDDSGLEADVVISRDNGDWIGIEVKLGGEDAVNAAAASLLKVSRRVDHEAVGPPRKLVVLTAVGNYAFDRTDGVAVVPITTLGP